MRMITYGIGGHDSSKPNNNIIEDIEVPFEVDDEIKKRQVILDKLGLTHEEAKLLLGF